METAARDVPDFGPVVERRHLLQVARAQCPALTVVCAPPGYGKSVLAAQIAASLSCKHVLWVPLYETDVRGSEWLGRVIEALSPLQGNNAAAPVPLPLSPESARADDLLCIREGLAQYVGQSLLLVLDGANRMDSLDVALALARLVRDSTHSGSRVVVTCRSLTARDYAPDPSAVWLIGDQELRFDSAEVEALLVLAGHLTDGQTAADALLDRFAGHPALTCLMLRHPRTDDSASPPQDLVWHTRRLVSQIECRSFAMMYCVALLREGSVLELDACLDAAGEQRAEWESAQIAVPLLQLAVDERRTPVSFRMHAVLCDALLSSVSEGLDSSILKSLRASVIEHLHHIGDAARLEGVLFAACTHEEVAGFCEIHGAWLLHRCGAGTIDRCLGRVPAARAASSARLLLLRSAALRERELVEEAVIHANLSQRIAEVDGDTSTHTAAVLLAVRLALDAGDLGTAQPLLRQLGGPLRPLLSAPALCLCESYAAVVDAYAGRSADARVHLESAVMLLRDVDKRSQEAIWSANCIAGVEGQLLGRWDLASAQFASIRTWPGVTPSQSLQCNANAAVALLEMGSIREAEALLESVLDDSVGAELQLLRAYAVGTLADVRWTLYGIDSQGLLEQSRRVFSYRGDRAALAGEYAIQAMLHRAAGAGEESLSQAESALTHLRDGDCSLSLFRLAAEIEVAASMLALGDRWGARRLGNRVQKELAGSGASTHLLCIDMVLAELERQEGDSEAAIARLRRHAEYVGTGSANWRTAMYIRAFPGLLELLAAALGADALPLRMLRLLSSGAEEPAMAAEPPSCSDSRSIVGARLLGMKEASRGATAPRPAVVACRVRVFGGLEVTVGDGIIDDPAWRKRKARQVFAMLVVRQGRDLSREVIMERLWPDMDEERARRNFYVTWSTMKRVLALGAMPSDASGFVQCVGGVCRVTRQVGSDLDDFDGALCRLRAAVQVQDYPGVLRAAQDIQDIYRGELLPGDLYDEWFIEVRERARHDFCDAMMSAAVVAATCKQPEAALVQLRRASEVDPWREDIYQAMMRCQINAGQRSRAIETYLACRAKLVEELGIDPSLETTRLYQAVLTMEAPSRS